MDPAHMAIGPARTARPGVRVRSSWRPRPAPVRDGDRLRVLVAYTGWDMATWGIAAALARSLSSSADAGRLGLTTALAPVQHRPDPTGFDAVVLGSTCDRDGWREPARSYAAAVAPELSRRATWLFSSGTCPAPGGPDLETVETFARSVGARDHRFFGGRVDPRVLAEAQPSDWWGVRAWSAGIVSSLALDSDCAGAV